MISVLAQTIHYALTSQEGCQRSAIEQVNDICNTASHRPDVDNSRIRHSDAAKNWAYLQRPWCLPIPSASHGHKALVSGTRIYHATFGFCVVQGRGDSKIVSVAFEGGGSKTLVAGMAPIVALGSGHPIPEATVDVDFPF